MNKFYLSALFSLSLIADPAPSENETTCIETHTIEGKETQESMENWKESVFGLKPHKPNYILPIGVGSGEYDEYVVSDDYRNIEAELQISLKWNIGNNLFGLNESYNLAYSHKAFWQIYSSSSPFRETNYNPEFFVKFPIEDSSIFNLKFITYGLAHISNGQGNIEDTDIPVAVAADITAQSYLKNRSRSINYMYLDFESQYENFLLNARVWIPYFGEDLNDNPDIIDYTGLTKLGFKYFYGKNLISVDTNLNLKTLNGSLTATHSYPIYDGIFLYTKFFTGYGESLIDYNNYITKFSIGFSFSR
ncbi:MAG: phospholipase A [Campylobacterota bacterium]|nr:phospholipase A [Campylobacterota bacterium]